MLKKEKDKKSTAKTKNAELIASAKSTRKRSKTRNNSIITQEKTLIETATIAILFF
jgi:hypothetical protein